MLDDCFVLFPSMLISKTFPIGDYVYEYVQLSKPVKATRGRRGQQYVYLREDLSLSCVFRKGLTLKS